MIEDVTNGYADEPVRPDDSPGEPVRRDDSPEDLSDDTLLASAKKGNKADFETFYDRHKRRIVNYVYNMIHNRESAEEITQEVFARVYMSLRRYRPQGRAINWLYTISGNLCRNYIRDNRHEPLISLDKELDAESGITLKDIIPADAQGPDDTAVSKEEEELIHRQIQLMPIPYKEVLVLCYIQGLSYDEVAEVLHTNIGSVGSRLNRARLMLAKALRKHYRG